MILTWARGCCWYHDVHDCSDPTAGRDRLPPRTPLLAFLPIAIALTMAVLDGTIVNVALPSIAAELSLQPEESIWIVNIYNIAITISLLPLASLGDSIGYRRVYWWGC